jgi:hypothetical protein
MIMLRLAWDSTLRLMGLRVYDLVYEVKECHHHHHQHETEARSFLVILL